MNVTFFYTKTSERPTKTHPNAYHVEVVKFYTWKASFGHAPVFMNLLAVGNTVILRPQASPLNQAWEIINVYVAPLADEVLVQVKPSILTGSTGDVSKNPVLRQLFGGGEPEVPDAE